MTFCHYLSFIGLVILLAVQAEEPCFRAHDPGWAGVWIWAAPRKAPPALEVNLRAWLENRPGGDRQTILHRLYGNAAIAGYRQIFWHLDDGYGHLLYPAGGSAPMLTWPNWGIDFGAFDYPAGALQLSERLGIRTVLVVAPEFLAGARQHYPQAQIITPDAMPAGCIPAAELAPDPWRWLEKSPMLFRKRFRIGAPLESAQLCVAANDQYRMQLDGKLIGCGYDGSRGNTYDLTALLPPGEHEFLAEVIPGAELAGLLLNLRGDAPSSPKLLLTTGLDWECKRKDEAGWRPVIATGFEGAGARFRLKEPWGYPTAIMTERHCHEALSAPQPAFPNSYSDQLGLQWHLQGSQEATRPRVAQAGGDYGLALAFPCTKTAPGQAEFRFEPVHGGTLAIDFDFRIDGKAQCLNFAVLPEGLKTLDHTATLIWLLWDGQKGVLQNYSSGYWQNTAGFTVGQWHHLRLILALSGKAKGRFAMSLDGGAMESEGLEFRNCGVEEELTAGSLRFITRESAGTGIGAWIDNVSVRTEFMEKHEDARIRRLEFPCEALGRVQHYAAVLPEGIAADAPKEQKLLVVLHGRGRNHLSLLQDEVTRKALLSFDGVVVLPEGDDSWYIDSPVKSADRYQSMLEELLADVSQRLPVSPERAKRGIAGWSMGGYGCIRFAEAHPEQFAAAASLIGLLDFPRAGLPEGQNYVVPAERFGKDPAVWAKFNPMAQAERLAGMKILMVTGAQSFDRTMNEHFRDRLKERGILCEYRQLSGAHTFTTVEQAMPLMVDFMKRQLH